MKKVLFAAALILGYNLNVFANDPIVNEKVLEAFNKTFQNVEELSWTANDHSYEANFKQSQITTRVTYDKQGNIIKTIRSYYEQHLPIIILAKIKNKFSDQKIFGVTEISSEEGMFYYIVLEDDKNWTEIKADTYGAINVQKKFKKG
ncbi:MAG TPA: hypothetical protein VFR58_07370 [Flavisolibacter sp.]|nr:hypothetical protein [Flavisolibacter sp.]